MPIKNFPFSNGGISNSPTRPWLPIKIVNPHTHKYCFLYGLIDTGATSCTIPANLAHILGHTLEKGECRQGTTAGGTVKSYFHTTKIEIYDFSNKHCHTIEETPIAFLPELPIVLLGVEQFLSQFELYINYPGKKFSITYPSQQKHHQV